MKVSFGELTQAVKLEALDLQELAADGQLRLLIDSVNSGGAFKDTCEVHLLMTKDLWSDSINY